MKATPELVSHLISSAAKPAPLTVHECSCAKTCSKRRTHRLCWHFLALSMRRATRSGWPSISTIFRPGQENQGYTCVHAKLDSRRLSDGQALTFGCNFQLEDLFVIPKARNIGVGKAFFAELGKIAESKVYSTCRYCPCNTNSRSRMSGLRSPRLVRTQGKFFVCVRTHRFHNPCISGTSLQLTFTMKVLGRLQ